MKKNAVDLHYMQLTNPKDEMSDTFNEGIEKSMLKGYEKFETL